MYNPSDDTFFIADAIVNFNGDCALEIGIGSGYLTDILCKNYKFVLGTDLDYASVKHSKYVLTKFNNKFLICCDICEPIKSLFDIIISNPPYLPSISNDKQDNTIYGGQTGVETTLRILQLFKSNLKDKGKIIFVKSSLSDNHKINQFVEKNHLKKRTLAKKKYFYEMLEICEITKIKKDYK
ncbi:MAG: methyltransferase [Thermoproteota archaeon]|nr:methyltransferase [Thermoproteota archaeon]